jgi:hypothetical protein
MKLILKYPTGCTPERLDFQRVVVEDAAEGHFDPAAQPHSTAAETGHFTGSVVASSASSIGFVASFAPTC